MDRESISEDRELFSSSAIFGDLDDREVEAVLEVCKPVEMPYGEYVFREGDEGDRLYIVASGAVRISRVVPGAGEEAIAVLKRGACFGEMALLDPSVRSTDAVVDARCRLLTIVRDDFERLLASDRELAVKVLRSVVRLLSERLRQTNDHLRSIMTMAMF